MSLNWILKVQFSVLNLKDMKDPATTLITLRNRVDKSHGPAVIGHCHLSSRLYNKINNIITI